MDNTAQSSLMSISLSTEGMRKLLKQAVSDAGSLFCDADPRAVADTLPSEPDDQRGGGIPMGVAGHGPGSRLDDSLFHRIGTGFTHHWGLLLPAH